LVPKLVPNSSELRRTPWTESNCLEQIRPARRPPAELLIRRSLVRIQPGALYSQIGGAVPNCLPNVPRLRGAYGPIRTYLPIGAVQVRHGHAPICGFDRELHAFCRRLPLGRAPSSLCWLRVRGWKVDSRLSEHLSMGFA